MPTMQAQSDQQGRKLDAAFPLMRDYIIRRWRETGKPVQASHGDEEVCQRAHLLTFNPSGWWGTAWTAVERHRHGAGGKDAWLSLVRFEPCFRGLSRVPGSKPQQYIV